MKKLKKLTYKKAKKDCWDAFSKFIRQRDSGVCFTCGVRKHWKEMQAGHYVSRTHMSLFLDEINVNCQCLTKDSNLRMFNGKSKSISKVNVGDEIWGFNEENFSLERAVVLSVDSFIPDVLYEVELENGDKFYATPDHKVISNGKWVYVRDMLHNVSAYDILEI